MIVTGTSLTSLSSCVLPRNAYGGRWTDMVRQFRKLNHLLRSTDRIKVKVRPHLDKKVHYEVKQHREEVGSKLEELRAISSSDKVNVGRIFLNDFSVDEFRNCFQKPRIPVMISEPYGRQANSLPHSCPALVRLNLFLKLFKDKNFECGEDGDGYSIEIKLTDFLIYSRRFKDRFPLYIFDAWVPHWKGTPRKRIIIKKLFQPPKFFKQDYMACLKKEHRPPWKWLLIGPKYSGTAVHVDPLGTSAWNRLLFGEKLWLLFPPETPAELFKWNQNDSFCEEASDWLINVYPRTKCNSWPQEYKPLVAFQYPGDVIFVPAGWWHVVLNLKTSVAVTQNFVSEDNFALAWEKTSKEKPDLAVIWSKALLKYGPAAVTPCQLGSDFS